MVEEYNTKLNKYYKYIENNMFILDVEKLCGYSEFVLVYKNCTITDVRNSIFRHFECSHMENKKLFVTKTNNSITQSSLDCSDNATRMDISDDYMVLSESDELFRNLVNNCSEYFRPLYDMPCKVVYKIYLDDGHCTSDNANNA